mmetsp:Transcript_13564/g.34822  ORF Transcript_13564/g.34822 Transcript_13564/m.34822 type:complete len:224 (-) Transcript_13564:1316-1987(-)
MPKPKRNAGFSGFFCFAAAPAGSPPPPGSTDLRFCPASLPALAAAAASAASSSASLLSSCCATSFAASFAFSTRGMSLGATLRHSLFSSSIPNSSTKSSSPLTIARKRPPPRVSRTSAGFQETAPPSSSATSTSRSSPSLGTRCSSYTGTIDADRDSPGGPPPPAGASWKAFGFTTARPRVVSDTAASAAGKLCARGGIGPGSAGSCRPSHMYCHPSAQPSHL